MAPAAVASIDNKQLAQRVLEGVYSRARDGRIVEHWGVRDDLGLLQQLELLSLG